MIGCFKKAVSLIAFVSVFLSGFGTVYAAEPVVYRLKWLVNMSTVGDIYALDKGYFADQGLDVEVKAGGPERDAIRELELGYADFGVASADQIIRALEKGAPLVVLAQLFQRNPLNWIFRPEKLSIEGLQDLKGRTLGVTFGKNDEFIMRTLLAQAGIAEDQVQLYSVRLDYTPFYQGKVDLWPIYINSQGVEIAARMRRSGETIAFFSPENFGVRFVANSVVTSERLWRDNPQLVRRFMQALLKGWQEALDPTNALQAVAVVRRHDPDTAPEIMSDQLEATRPLIMTGGTVGRIDREAWAQTEQIMLAHGQIKAPVNVLGALQPILEQLPAN
jgi:NitT/TauT family transport system substrate-binding protein